MKELYENAEMNVVLFGAEDIINTSDAGTTNNSNHFCPNEGSHAGDSFL